ncbi:MAG: cold shock domain-containing protein [Burkholderiaceae bacterium]
MPDGIIVTWRDDKGWGFIESDDGDRHHHFFHQSEASCVPREGMRVEFRLGERRGRECAVSVRPIDPEDFVPSAELAGLFKTLRPQKLA